MPPRSLRVPAQRHPHADQLRKKEARDETNAPANGREAEALRALRPSDDAAARQLLEGLRLTPLPAATPGPAVPAAAFSAALTGLDLAPRNWNAVTHAFNKVLAPAGYAEVSDSTDFMAHVMASNWWRLPGGGLPPGCTVSPWKVHFAAETPDQVMVLAAHLAPVLQDRGMASKFAGKQLLKSDNERQNRKGAVVYLPRRTTLAHDIAVLAAATDGLRSDINIPGDVSFAPGMGVRCDWALDLGCDLPPGQAPLMYVPAALDPLDSDLQQLHALWSTLRQDHPGLALPETILNLAYRSDHGTSLAGTKRFLQALTACVSEMGPRSVLTPLKSRVSSADMSASPSVVDRR